MYIQQSGEKKDWCEEFQKDNCRNPQCKLLHKFYPCPDYDKGFCCMGSACDKKHIVRKLCLDYLYGFCKDGPECKLWHVKLFDQNDKTQELRFTEKYYSKLKQENEIFRKSDINVRPVICNSCQEVGHKSNVCKKSLRLSPTRKILCGICETEHTIMEQGKRPDCQYQISQFFNQQEQQ